MPEAVAADIKHTCLEASIRVVVITVVALLARVECAVAAGFQLTGGAATIALTGLYAKP